MIRVCIVNVLVSGALSAMGGSCQNLSGPGTYHFKYIADTGEILGRWGKLGTLLDRNVSGWGSHVTPRATFLTTDWFACKVQIWKPDGTWLNTFRSAMRSDGYSIKCKNTSAAAKYLYQRVSLPEGSYTIQFLAFTDGSDLSQDEDVVPYAEKAVGDEPTGNNAVGTPSYAEDVLTYVNIAPGNRLHYFVSGAFQVQEGQSGDWYLGVQVKPNKTGYVASLACTEE